MDTDSVTGSIAWEKGTQDKINVIKATRHDIQALEDNSTGVNTPRTRSRWRFSS